VTEQLRAHLSGVPTPLHVHAVYDEDPDRHDHVLRGHQQAIADSLAPPPAADALQHEAPAWSRSHLDILPVDQNLDVSLALPHLHRPVPTHILHSRVDEGFIWLDLLFAEGDARSRIQLALRPVPHRAHDRALVTASPVPPDPYGPLHGSPPEPTSPSYTLAIVGTLGGIAVGMLAGFLVWA
jgi:hypothetical protein